MKDKKFLFDEHMLAIFTLAKKALDEGGKQLNEKEKTEFLASINKHMKEISDNYYEVHEKTRLDHLRAYQRTLLIDACKKLNISLEGTTLTQAEYNENMREINTLSRKYQEEDAQEIINEAIVTFKTTKSFIIKE